MSRSLVNIVSAYPNKNYIINGNFDYWQRGTSFNTINNYAADRWFTSYGSTSGTATVSRNNLSSGMLPGDTKYGLSWNQSVAGTGNRYIAYRIEGVRQLSGKVMTLSFWANTNSGTKTFDIYMQQQFGSGGSTAVTLSSSPMYTIGTSWQQYIYTFTVPSVAGKTIGTGDYLYIQWTLYDSTFSTNFAQFMLNEGPIPIPFLLAGGNTINELALCQRYYEKSYDIDVIPGTATYNGSCNGRGSGTYAAMTVQYKATKRINNAPSIYSPYNGATGYVYDASGSANVGASTSYTGSNCFEVHASVSNTGQWSFHWACDAEF